MIFECELYSFITFGTIRFEKSPNMAKICGEMKKPTLVTNIGLLLPTLVTNIGNQRWFTITNVSNQRWFTITNVGYQG